MLSRAEVAAIIVGEIEMNRRDKFRSRQFVGIDGIRPTPACVGLELCGRWYK